MYKVQTGQGLQSTLKMAQEFLDAGEVRNAEKIVQQYFSVNQEEIAEQFASDEIREWVEEADGEFKSTQVATSLHLSTKCQKKNLSQVLGRLIKEGVIERVGKKYGEFRKVDDDCPEMEWWEAPRESIKLEWPFELEKIVEILPKSIVIIAGISNVGKTAFFINLIVKNIDKKKLYYFSSEMDETEVRKRFELVDGLDVDKWRKNLKVFQRAHSFQDVVSPDGINMIDYLDDEEAYKIKHRITKIRDKLNKGIAIIALQKPRGRDEGYGGEQTKNLPRLYLSIDNSLLKIVKAKNWKTHENPNGKIHEFKLINGSQFLPQGLWHDEYRSERKFKKTA